MYAQMESIHTMQRRGIVVETQDDSDEENEFEQPQEEGEEADDPRECIMKSLEYLRGKP